MCPAGRVNVRALVAECARCSRRSVPMSRVVRTTHAMRVWHLSSGTIVLDSSSYKELETRWAGRESTTVSRLVPRERHSLNPILSALRKLERSPGVVRRCDGAFGFFLVKIVIENYLRSVSITSTTRGVTASEHDQALLPACARETQLPPLRSVRDVDRELRLSSGEPMASVISNALRSAVLTDRETVCATPPLATNGGLPEHSRSPLPAPLGLLRAKVTGRQIERASCRRLYLTSLSNVSLNA
jgi:hypothetical protein